MRMKRENAALYMDKCVCCGAEVPEGRMICWNCENGTCDQNQISVIPPASDGTEAKNIKNKSEET